MTPFSFRTPDGLYTESVAATDLAARFGTPLYVYSAAAFRAQFRALRDAFAAATPLICYSVKACSNLSILRLLKDEGSGFDCVSAGEIFRCLEIGAAPERIVFAGAGKREDEIEYALKAGVLMLNVESEGELALIARVAGRLGREASVALRLNPDVDAKTHHYITTGKSENKFGISLQRAAACLDFIGANPALRLRGVHVHIGSQITTFTPHADAVRRVGAFIARARAEGFTPEYLNVGGGYGISYTGEEGPPITDFAASMLPVVKETGLKLALEPGRFIAGNSAIILTRVLYLKRGAGKTFAIVDAAMNDLMRPSMYDAFHRVWPVHLPERTMGESEGVLTDIVGPICETGDFLAKGRRLPELREGDLLALHSAGAYGFSMSSNYNSRPRAAEVLVDGVGARVIRRRETLDDLIRHERPAEGP